MTDWGNRRETEHFMEKMSAAPKKKILIVDDERDIVKALMIRLQANGYGEDGERVVAGAGTGREGRGVPHVTQLKKTEDRRENTK